MLPIAPSVADAIQARLGVTIVSGQRVTGGDINDAFVVRSEGGDRFFVKVNQAADRSIFPAEARGLAWLAEPGCLAVPDVLAVCGDTDPIPFLVLRYVEPGRPGRETSERLGRGLAALHRKGPDHFGLDHDNFIGRLPQDNTPDTEWVSFWRDRRLLPQIRRAGRHLSTSLRRDLDLLMATLHQRLGPPEAPARLHGDLWGGNLLVDVEGNPWLIDPAAYAGHREADLAMMKLFGGFDARCFAAYHEAWPLAPGLDERIAIYQLYYLLVHVNLFGSGWVGQVQSTLYRVM